MNFWGRYFNVDIVDNLYNQYECIENVRPINTVASMIRPGLPEEAPVLRLPLEDERQSVGDDDDGGLLRRRGGILVVAVGERPHVRGVCPAVEQGIQGCI